MARMKSRTNKAQSHKYVKNKDKSGSGHVRLVSPPVAPVALQLVSKKRLGRQEKKPKAESFSLTLKAFVTSSTIIYMVTQFFQQLGQLNMIPYPELASPLLLAVVHVFLQYLFTFTFHNSTQKTVRIFMVIVAICLAVHVQIMSMMQPMANADVCRSTSYKLISFRGF